MILWYLNAWILERHYTYSLFRKKFEIGTVLLRSNLYKYKWPGV